MVILAKCFPPKIGLRQGDLLSLYLFILCANVISSLLKKEVMNRNINGIQVSKRAPSISHIFFVDDIILFSRANATEVERTMEVLSTYQKASGQVMKLDKSEASFSRNFVMKSNK